MQQWEINLRKDLKGVKKKKPESKAISKWIIVLLLLVSFIALIGIKLDLSQYWTKKSEITTVESKPEIKPVPPVVNGTKELRSELEKIKLENKEKFDDLNVRLSKNIDRVRLLGMMNNENWLVIRNQGPNSEEFIYFNSDWTVNRMPQYLKISPADRMFLRRNKK